MKRMACLRAIAFALILLMLAGILPAPTFAAGDTQFDDVKSADWFYSAVETVCEKGLMTGTSARTFNPDQPVTRGMLAAILYRLENQPEAASGSPFTDVPAGAYYERRSAGQLGTESCLAMTRRISAPMMRSHVSSWR